MKTNDSHLMSAMRRLTRRTARPALRLSNDPHDWQQLIESELNALNRRLSSIEARMTVVFYLVVILTITTIVTNANAAEQLMRGVLQIK